VRHREVLATVPASIAPMISTFSPAAARFNTDG
jgi:hypothetical protein